MLILDTDNNTRDTDQLSEACFYSVLRFRDPKNPDFYFEELTYIEEFSSHTMKIEVGGYPLFVPFHWSVLCSDQEYIQTIPLYEFSGRPFCAFCINPIDGFSPYYPEIRIVEVFSNSTWTCPPIHDKDMLVVPIGPNPSGAHKGPLCIILSPHKLDVNRSLSDIM
jgi:hypothetical protein